MSINDVESLIKQLKDLQTAFYDTFAVTDIITNSKIFEILIADALEHTLIPGHSGSRDAKDKEGKEIEYKHFKELSSNHSWTFNDFSDTTIQKLANIKSVIFAHINDEKEGNLPEFDWYYEVPGKVVSDYLKESTLKIQNHRKMINVSPKQIEERMGFTKIYNKNHCEGVYSTWIKKIVEITDNIEKAVNTKGILTSNKFWEVLVALKLNHQVQSEQLKHDAVDSEGNTYEYKVSKSTTWSFQDISEDVLLKYKTNKSIILAVVDKNDFSVKTIYEANTESIIDLLKKKLLEKQERYTSQGKTVRRIQASLSGRDMVLLKATKVYPVV